MAFGKKSKLKNKQNLKNHSKLKYSKFWVEFEVKKKQLKKCILI